MPFRACRSAALLLCVSVSPGVAQAGVVINCTRVIYPANRKEVSVNLRNVGEAPSLVQAWIDAGEGRAEPANASVPFAIVPPLFRLDPTKGQTLRIMYSQAALAADRETVFWLNVLDVPPRVPVNPDAPNRLEMAFRHRLKLFFRPTGLRGNPADAAKQIEWILTRKDGKLAIEARNPTPYFISLTSATVTLGAPIAALAPPMLAPFSSSVLALAQTAAGLPGTATVTYSFVNDFGGVVTGEATARTAA
ncbi:fimbria/pilus periplasmic chaperone [Sphingomonas sp. H39-1-10]|uniref:fimbria/pilus periplasmic chaperone n=1 Tax=Sphingomonas pollutisoli TaxID=3030829 RepID=UPI0023B94B13|nr:fimbria/pilus periplasmic chaperone [Sphingomonas pollutisoli]MDF0489975.1 fimbria/pilus periplasmic chaperone [Sphingomonas pollutisoli]